MLSYMRTLTPMVIAVGMIPTGCDAPGLGESCDARCAGRLLCVLGACRTPCAETAECRRQQCCLRGVCLQVTASDVCLTPVFSGDAGGGDGWSQGDPQSPDDLQATGDVLVSPQSDDAGGQGDALEHPDEGGGDLEPPAANLSLFGVSYCVSSLVMTGASFVGGTVTGVPSNASGGFMNLDFDQGASPSDDHLVVGYDVEASTAGSQLFELTGPSAEGLFSASSTVTFYYGPSVLTSVGGRPSAVLVESRLDTGSRLDANFLVATYEGDNFLRAYDLDSFTSLPASYSDDAIASVDRIGGFDPYALEHSDLPGRILVGAQIDGVESLLTADAALQALDDNAVALPTCCGFPAADRIGDLARFADGTYLATSYGSKSILHHLTVGVAGSPPVITASEIAAHDLDATPIPGTDAAWVVGGLAVGRDASGTEVIYVTGRTGQMIELFMLTPQPSAGCN